MTKCVWALVLWNSIDTLTVKYTPPKFNHWILSAFHVAWEGHFLEIFGLQTQQSKMCTDWYLQHVNHISHEAGDVPGVCI